MLNILILTISFLQTSFNLQFCGRIVSSKAACCYTWSSMVSLCVCLLVPFVTPAKMIEPIEMPFGVVTQI